MLNNWFHVNFFWWQDTVFDPVSLTCGHIFCYICACSAASVSIVDGLKAAEPKEKCPLCREVGYRLRLRFINWDLEVGNWYSRQALDPGPDLSPSISSIQPPIPWNLICLFSTGCLLFYLIVCVDIQAIRNDFGFPMNNPTSSDGSLENHSFTCK